MLEQGPGKDYELGMESQIWEMGFVPKVSDSPTTVIVQMDENVEQITVEPPLYP